jgi:hypothetical protein
VSVAGCRRARNSFVRSESRLPTKTAQTDPGESSASALASSPPPKRHGPDIDLETAEIKNGESIATLRRMVLGKAEYNPSQTA